MRGTLSTVKPAFVIKLRTVPRATCRWFGIDSVAMWPCLVMRWSVDQAVAAARELARFGVYWLEEPIEPDDYEGHRRVADACGVPLVAGENLRTVSEFAHLIGAGGVAFPEPDVSNIGGISAWMRVAELAAAHRLPVTSHGVHELHVHLLAAVPNASFLEVHGFATERFVRQPPRRIHATLDSVDLIRCGC